MGIHYGVGVLARKPQFQQPLAYNFWRGVNLNGGVVTIDGRTWLSFTDALSQGLAVTSYTALTSGATPSPAVSAETQTMLQSGIRRNTDPITLTQTVPNGIYQAYLWVMETQASNYRAFNVLLQGAQVAIGLADGFAIGRWARYGPYQIAAASTSVEVILTPTKQGPIIQGLEFWSVT